MITLQAAEDVDSEMRRTEQKRGRAGFFWGGGQQEKERKKEGGATVGEAEV